ncbi:MAG: ribosome maturation factor RimP [Deltaproteobacteria bacterium]|nr:ribosome maturation factor RimP [Deltaproteobacteria bacterium]
MPPSSDAERRIRDLLEEVVEAHGYDLVAVFLTRSAGRRVLRLHIDRPGGVGLEDCRRVSLSVSPLLDVHDPLPGAYDLEVSSPGKDRPLQRIEDFRRFAGHRVRLRLEPGPGSTRVTGVLVGLEDETVLVETAGGIERVPLSSVTRAHLVLDFEEYRRLGSVDLDDGTPDLPGPDSP